MKLQNQVCSLKLSKRLKELGVKQGSSMFHWSENNGGDWVLWKEPSSNKMNEKWLNLDANKHYYDAFTVAELINLLPLGTHCGKAWRGELEFFAELQPHYVEYNKSLPDALANILIQLKLRMD